MDKNKKTIIALFFLLVLAAITVFFITRERYAIIVGEERLTQAQFQEELQRALDNMTTEQKELTSEEEVKNNVVEILKERMKFSIYLNSLDINITQKEIDAKYQEIVDASSAINSKEELLKSWEEQGVSLKIIEKQIKEDIIYEKLAAKYLEEVEIEEGILEEEYQSYMQGVEDYGWAEISKEDLEEQLRYNEVHRLIEEERRAVEEDVEVEILI